MGRRWGHRKDSVDGASGRGERNTSAEDAKKRITSREGRPPVYAGETRSQKKKRLQGEAEAKRRSGEGLPRPRALDFGGQEIDVGRMRMAGRLEATSCRMTVWGDISRSICQSYARNEDKGENGICLGHCKGERRGIFDW